MGKEVEEQRLINVALYLEYPMGTGVRTYCAARKGDFPPNYRGG